MLGINDDEDDCRYTSDPDFISPKKAKKETVKKRGHNTPVKSWSFGSKFSEDKRNPPYVKIGDLIMSTASEINHPDYLSGRIGGGYIFLVLQGVTVPLKIRSIKKRSMSTGQLLMTIKH